MGEVKEMNKQRRKHVLLTLTAVVLLMMLVLPINVMAANSNIIPNSEAGIADTVLYQVILRKLNKTGKTFTKDEALKIKHLRYNGSNKESKIKSLKGINKLKNLRTLDFYGNSLISLSGIEGLTKLERLEVGNNELVNLSGVENLINLTCINATYNQLKSVRSVRNLVKLSSLDIDKNRLKNLDGVEGLTGLEFLYATRNRLTRLPDMNKLSNLSIVEFKWNRISEKELNKKLPKGWKRNSLWYKTTAKLQNLVRTIELVQPASFDKVNVNTKKIIGIANKNSTIVLRDPRGKKIAAVRSNAKGKFTFKKLNLNQWAEKSLSLEANVVDKFYYDETYRLKKVKFIVGN